MDLYKQNYTAEKSPVTLMKLAGLAVAFLVFFSFKADKVNGVPSFAVMPINYYNNSSVTHLLLLVGACWLLYKVKDIILAPLKPLKTVGIVLLSSVFSLFCLLGVYFDLRIKLSFTDLLSSAVSFLCFVLAFIGGTAFFAVVIRLLWHVGENFCSFRFNYNEFLSQFFGEYMWRNCIVTIAVCWLPQYIIRFPGVVPYDVWQSVAMHYGYAEMTTQHPLIWGAFIGYLTELGEKIGIGWLAPLVVCFIQHVLGILMVTYTVATLRRFRFNPWVLCGVLVFFIILPPMSLYASTLYNDFFYGLAIMLLVVELVYYLYSRSEFFTNRRHLILTAVAVFGTIYRYNGLYTMAAVIAVVGARELWFVLKGKASPMRSLTLVLLCMIIPLSCGQIVQKSLNASFDAKEIRSRAMLAMPIQQSVRCLIAHGDTMDKEIYDDLHAVLTWTDEQYAKKYNPRNFDGVKESFKIDASSEEMSGFIKAWLKLVIKYPFTCFMATANQNYYMFSTLATNQRYYESIEAHTDKAMERYFFDCSPYVLHNATLRTLCNKLLHFEYNIFPGIPVLGLITSPAVYTLLLLGISLFFLFCKDRRALVIAVPMLVTLAITFLGPAFYNHPRYVYPIMYCMPVFLAIFVLPKKIKTNTEV